MGKKVNKNKKNKAFTLVELIVVITILAILGTIAFITMQDFSSEARDSQRLTDISQFKSGIVLYNARTGDYPMPDNPSAPVYVDDVVKYQGDIGKLSSMNAGLSKTITDPLTGENYGYSITGVGLEYEVKFNLENSSASIFSDALAESLVSEIDGNYNGVFATTKRGAFVSMPSLFSDVPDGLDLSVPRASNFSIDKSGRQETFTPTLIAASKPKTTATHTEFIKNIQSAYGGTPLETDSDISRYMNVNPVTEQVKVIELAKSTFGSDAEFGVVQNCSGTNHGDSKEFYSSSSVAYNLSDCSSVAKTFTCVDGTWLDNLSLSKDGTGYNFEVCSPAIENSCDPNPSYTGSLSHTYNVGAIAAGATGNATVDVLENNGTFRYTMTATCTNGNYTSVSETSTPTIVSCDSGFHIDGNSCSPNDCSSGSITGANGTYNHTAFSDGGTTTGTGQINHVWGNLNISASLSCTSGVVSINSESNDSATCNEGYSPEGSLLCKADCTSGIIDGSQVNNYIYPALDHNTSTTVYKSKSISGGSKNYSATVSCSGGNVNLHSETLLSVDCSDGYHQDGNYCTSDTRTVSCSGSIDSNGSATTSSTYNQTWTGSSWPTVASWTYGASTCGYTCNSSYTWDGNSCKADCSAGTYVGSNTTYNYDGFDHGTQKTVYGSKDTTGGTQTFKLILSCSSGTASLYSESWYSTTCDSGYSQSGSGCFMNCSAGTINGTQASGYSYSSMNHGTSQTNVAGTKTISNGYQDYTANVSCNNGNASVSNEVGGNITCNSGYVEDGGRCIMPAKFSQIDGNLNNTCGVTLSGGVQCWGDGETKPKDIAGLSSGVIKVGVGEDHACALMDTGEVKCWGNSYYGQLGNGTFDTSKDTYSGPVNVIGLDWGATDISVGQRHTCAIVGPVGWLKCWGANNRGQLGNSNTTNQSQAVLINISTLVNISAGGEHTCGVISDGDLYCWGYNGSGQLGDGTNITRKSPQRIIHNSIGKVATGGNHTCVIYNTTTKLGKVKCWGNNWYSQLGTGNTTSYNTPTVVATLRYDDTPSASEISAGGYHTCVKLTTGEMQCWGANSYGQLGLGTQTGATRPEYIPGMSSGINNIGLGYWHSCATLTSGYAKCWGRNTYGELGDGTTSDKYVPTYIIK